MRAPALALVVILGFTAPVATPANELIGSWIVTIDAPGVLPYRARLDIEAADGGLIAFVENGPAPIVVDRDDVEIEVDARDRQGFRFSRILSGKLTDDGLRGTVAMHGILETAAEQGENGAPWHAVRIESTQANDSSSHELKDFTGTWVGVRGVDLRKYSMALTEQAKHWVATYDARMDEPQKRCVSPGLVAAATWIFPFEIVADDRHDRLVFLYEAFGLSRRIHVGDAELPEFYPESSMGYSRARLSDGFLDVETTLLAPSTRDFNGEPVGENARITERYFLTDDGNQLNMVMHLHDPDNYERPPIRRRAWQRNDDALIFPFECDPDSFFRQLYSEGRMQDYIDRAHMRP